jgi:uncharacterized repeat protein (TIGR03803 family)
MTTLQQRSGMLWLVIAVAATAIAPAQAQTTYSETVLHNFGIDPPKGDGPSGVIRDEAGNLYGTTYLGGTWGEGVVYRVDKAGRQTVLHNFTGGAQGATPTAGVIRDSAGNLYGTTRNGGSFNGDVCSYPVSHPVEDGCGIVYELDAAGQETVLYTFTGGTDGAAPYAGVVRDTAGNLYGTTEFGGRAGFGVVYKVDQSGQETVLYSFQGGADGSIPLAGVILDPAGNLYGTNTAGGDAVGTEGHGVVYRLDPAGHERALYAFTGGADGSNALAGVVRDSAGNLYGTTACGGTGPAQSFCTGGAGVVYKLDTAGHQTVLHTFTGGADGAVPQAGVVLDEEGNLYGTTSAGGAGNCPGGCGVLFKLDTAGHETVLYSFPGGSNGSGPTGAIVDSAGNIYGSTNEGGVTNFLCKYGCGTVYKRDTASQETVLYSFPVGIDGYDPIAGVIVDSAGNLYGTAAGGGTTEYGGIVYKVDSSGYETVLYNFTGGADGGDPFAGIIADSASNFYGTTRVGGTADAGVVYKLDTSGHETVLHSFDGGAAGAGPEAGVIRDLAGNLYGTTTYGGSGDCEQGCGVVFELEPAGRYKVLYTFTGGADGANPTAGLIRDSAGALYGTAYQGGRGSCYPEHGCGVVFKLDTTGNYTVLYRFTGDADGGNPIAGVIADSAGNLYGTTSGGAGTCYYPLPAGCGVVFKLDPAGQETVLYSFTGRADGGYPTAGVIRDSAGNLYGTTHWAGAARQGGVVYVLDTAGRQTLLHTFAGSGSADGANPSAGVIRDSAGNLYGTTTGGGKQTEGVIFKLTPQ